MQSSLLSVQIVCCVVCIACVLHDVTPAILSIAWENECRNASSLCLRLERNQRNARLLVMLCILYLNTLQMYTAAVSQSNNTY